jgi:hypothetical protein
MNFNNMNYFNCFNPFQNFNLSQFLMPGYGNYGGGCCQGRGQYGDYYNGGCGQQNWREYMQDRKDDRMMSERLSSNKLDLNNDGKYNSGIDGRLAIDWDGDGISKEDIKKTKQAFKRFDDIWDGSDEDDDDAPDLKQFDKNNDGKLDSEELKKAGASVWVDRNGDGERNRGEFYKPDKIDSRYRKDLELEVDLETGEMSTEKTDDD